MSKGLENFVLKNRRVTRDPANVAKRDTVKIDIQANMKKPKNKIDLRYLHYLYDKCMSKGNNMVRRKHFSFLSPTSALRPTGNIAMK